MFLGARPRYSELPDCAYWGRVQESYILELVELLHRYGAMMDEDGLHHYDSLLEPAVQKNL
jgi:hypothetical protein